MTDPARMGWRRFSEPLVGVGRALRDALHPPPPYLRSSYRGHFAVTRSAVEGLRKIGVRVNYAPVDASEIGEAVVVLSGVAALRQAVAMKRAGRIRVLLAGPNIVVFPSELCGLIDDPAIDACLVPSDWVAELYQEDCPGLTGRCRSWPAGVDTDFWTPAPKKSGKRRVLIFVKPQTNPIARVEDYLRVLTETGYSIETLKYSTFGQEEYRDFLRRADLLIGFSGSESQGIAWAEAWATDTPTLVWRQGGSSCQGRSYRSSTAPYLSEANGRFFSDVEEFAQNLRAFESGQWAPSPRAWVVDNMSDEVCARRLCRLAGIHGR